MADRNQKAQSLGREIGHGRLWRFETIDNAQKPLSVPSTLFARGAVAAVAVFGIVLCAIFWQRGGFAALQLILPLCLAMLIASLLLLVSSARSLSAPAGFGTLCFAAIGIIAVAIPASQLVSGQRSSILARLGVYSPNVIDDAPRAGLVFLLCMCTFALSELLPLSLPSRNQSHDLDYWETPRLYWSLLFVGLLATLLLGNSVSTESLAERGQVNGNGIPVVLQQCFILSVALGIANGHWGRRWLAVVSAIAVVFSLAYTGSRSGLLIVVAALGARWLYRIQLRGLGARVVIGLSALAYLSATFIVGFAQWRIAFREQGGADLLTYLFKASADPIGQLSGQGALDTFDGLVLSLNVDPRVVGANILDPLRAILNLVPSQVWSDKPGYLGPEVTHYYTDFGGQAGIFLSGPGYAYIIAGGMLGASIFFLGVGVVFRALSARYWTSPIILTVLLYTLFRFIIGGDSFDLQYGLALVLSLGIGRGVTYLISRVDGIIRRGPK